MIDVIRKILTVIAVVMLVSGIALFLFPPVSNFIGQKSAEVLSDRFDESAENIREGTHQQAFENGEIDEEGYPIDKNGKRTSDFPFIYDADIKQLFEDSVLYNDDLKKSQSSKLINENTYSVPSINLENYGIYDGIYGYVYAPSIDMTLPVYLGASNDAMRYGAAHLTHTSLPVGGDNSNVVLAAHSGYIGRIFFDNVKHLNIGDEVCFKTYWTTLRYKVVETKIINEYQTQDIYIKEGEDLLTLITCINRQPGGPDRFVAICSAVE